MPSRVFVSVTASAPAQATDRATSTRRSVFGLSFAHTGRPAARATAPTTDSEDPDPTLPTDWRAVILLTISLLFYLFLMIPAGFIIASAILFTGAAFAMGSKRVVRDLALGLVFSVAIYLAFTAGLGLRLPAGILSGVL
mgnify:CR=1 FL=1